MSGRKERPMKLSDYIEIVRGAISPGKSDVIWQQVSDALSRITAEQSEEGEKVLVEILQIEGRILLSPVSEVPSVMSPRDMMKLQAIENLVKWTGNRYQTLIKQVYDSTTSDVLRSVARAALKELGMKES